MEHNIWAAAWITFILNLLVDKVTGSGVFQVDLVGTNLSCYTCKENYKTNPYNPRTDICQSKLSDVDVIHCGKKDRYCKVERVELHGVKISIERSCAELCYYGCKFQGYGLTYLKCTSCCRNNACNTDSKGTRILPTIGLLMILCGIAMKVR